ncbi:hypothetical protein KC366_g29 [Hortaea werneckii]|nr:hypothetical protein KC366_g29 [Hortaea werneckii]
MAVSPTSRTKPPSPGQSLVSSTVQLQDRGRWPWLTTLAPQSPPICSTGCLTGRMLRMSTRLSPIPLGSISSCQTSAPISFASSVGMTRPSSCKSSIPWRPHQALDPAMRSFGILMALLARNARPTSILWESLTVFNSTTYGLLNLPEGNAPAEIQVTPDNRFIMARSWSPTH